MGSARNRDKRRLASGVAATFHGCDLHLHLHGQTHLIDSLVQRHSVSRQSVKRLTLQQAHLRQCPQELRQVDLAGRIASLVAHL
jgi:hypothetical protein